MYNAHEHVQEKLDGRRTYICQKVDEFHQAMCSVTYQCPAPWRVGQDPQTYRGLSWKIVE